MTLKDELLHFVVRKPQQFPQLLPQHSMKPHTIIFLSFYSGMTWFLFCASESSIGWSVAPEGNDDQEESTTDPTQVHCGFHVLLTTYDGQVLILVGPLLPTRAESEVCMVTQPIFKKSSKHRDPWIDPS
jgi:hypothetical protein